MRQIVSLISQKKSSLANKASNGVQIRRKSGNKELYHHYSSR